MKNLTSLFISVLFATLALVLTPMTTTGQDPVKVAPDAYTVRLENDYVRVLEVRLKPGEKSPMHSYPAFVVYNFNASKVKFITPDERSKEVGMKAGEAAWSEGVTHAVENIGTTEAHVLNIELKEPRKKTAQSTVITEVAPDPLEVAPDRYKVLLENEKVRVLEAWHKAGEKINMHSHPDHLLYFFNGGKRRFTYPDGTTKIVEWNAGDVKWVPALAHAGENIGTTGSHLLIFDIKGQESGQ